MEIHLVKQKKLKLNYIKCRTKKQLQTTPQLHVTLKM
jgi:hypothetical protein